MNWAYLEVACADPLRELRGIVISQAEYRSTVRVHFYVGSAISKTYTQRTSMPSSFRRFCGPSWQVTGQYLKLYRGDDFHSLSNS
jgi:hypothetical protein